ncbi:MAG: sigma 54-interacting transcriptional regulator [Vicinamibacterales bacterium]
MTQSAPTPGPSPSPSTVEAALVRAARALTSHLNVLEVCDSVVEATVDVFEAESAWILLYDERDRALRTFSVRGARADAFRDVSIPPDIGMLGLVFRKREVVFVPDVSQESRWYDPARVQASGLRSVFMLPLVFGGKSLGVLGLDSPRFTAEHPPTSDDRGRLEALAAQAAVAVHNAWLYDASEREGRRLRALLQERQRLRGHVTHLEGEVRAIGAFGDLLGSSPAFVEALQQAALVAPADTTTLLLGETGTGKELLARFIHQKSPRSNGPFVAVNCAALPETLVESELFGYEKGAFTGANGRKPGKFEIAHRGTLLLDEVGDLPPAAQAKLLRVLQDGMVERVGATAATKVDVRIIAATNRDLAEASAAGGFRSDLYYRLSVFPIQLPPLRARPEDIEPLASHFARRATAKFCKPFARISSAALARMQEYTWPGNVRELQNVIERAVILASTPVLDVPLTVAPAALPVDSDVPSAAPARCERAATPKVPEVCTLADAERQAIRAALDQTNWRISGKGGAAEVLGLKPTTLHAKMKKLGIIRPTGQV